MLDGKPTILGGNEISVTQLQLSDKNITSKIAKNSLSHKRFDFGLAEVPLSLFGRFEITNEDKNVCPDIDFDDKNGWIYCENENENRICVLNCDIGYIPSSVEVFVCSLKNSRVYQWTTVSGQKLEDLPLVTCERPLVVIAGGNEVQ